MTVLHRVFVIGLGSMGKRRIRNLRRLGVPEIVGFDPRDDRRAEAEGQSPGIATVGNVDEGFARDPDAVVISTPPDFHVRYARQAVRRRTPFFMEASVVDAEIKTLAEEATRAGVVAAPSCTMRFQPSIRTMKRLIDEGSIGRIHAFTHHSGQYLPDWHPWEDYRHFYAGQRSTGACREIVPFELIWLTWVVGPVTSVAAMKGKVGNLDVDIDDVYQVLTSHQGGALGHLLVDVLARKPIRRCTFIGSDGTLEWNWAEKRVVLQRAGEPRDSIFAEEDGTVQPGYVHAEEPYVEEMRAFLSAVRGEAAWPYTLNDDIAILDLLSAAEASSGQGKRVEVHR